MQPRGDGRPEIIFPGDLRSWSVSTGCDPGGKAVVPWRARLRRLPSLSRDEAPLGGARPAARSLNGFLDLQRIMKTAGLVGFAVHDALVHQAFHCDRTGQAPQGVRIVGL